MNIRKAKLGDEVAIANVKVRTWQSAYKEIMPADYLNSLKPDKNIKFYHEQLSSNSISYDIFVLENDAKEIVGIASGGVERQNIKDCEIVAIYILPEYQKLGMGRKLFSAMIKSFVTKGYKSMLIWALEDNRDRKFYEKLGGKPSMKKIYNVANKELTVTGFVWDDIRALAITTIDL